MSEGTLTLRDAARRLARLRNPKAKGIASSELLSLLRSGELKAGFYILNGTAWIEIPLAHWERTGSNKLRSIGRNRNDPKSGAYRVRADKFPDQVATFVCKQIKSNEQTSERNKAKPNLDAVTTVLDAAAKSYEVTVKTKDFLDYLRRHGIEERTITGKAGRDPKEGWRQVCSYMAAYMAAHHRDHPTNAMKIEESARAIFDLANADGVHDLPSWATIKEEVSKAMALLEREDFRLKK